MSRHKIRARAVKLIYEWQFRGDKELPEFLAERMKGATLAPEDAKFIENRLAGVAKEIEKIDEGIEKAAPEWPIEQVALIDLAILRFSVYELLFCEDVPPKVAIDEAVELGKTYGGDNSSKFINGVLGTIFRSSNRYDAKRDE